MNALVRAGAFGIAAIALIYNAGSSCGWCTWTAAGLLGVVAFLYLLRPYFEGGVCTSAARLDGKVIIVTGSNTGIGKYTVQDFVNRGGKVYMACRSLDKATAAAEDILRETGASKDKVQVMKLDVSSLESVRQFAKEFRKKEQGLDLLVNNAGVMAIAERQVSVDGFEMQLATNHLGHFLLTHLLLDLLAARAPGSRVVVLSSSAHKMYNTFEFDDIQFEKSYGAWRAYAQSKLANVMFARELGKRLKGSGITTYSLHPGAINTDLQRHSWALNNPVSRHLLLPLLWKSIPQGAQTTICCAVDQRLAGETGKYYADCAEAAVLPAALVDADCHRLWRMSEEMVKLAPQEMPAVLAGNK